MINFIKLIEGEVTIVKEELLEIPEFAEVIRKDKGGIIQGDYDGRKKLFAKKQFALGWWVIDLNSPANLAGYTKKECLEDGIKQLGFPDGWKPDPVFKDFLLKYEQLYERYAIAVMVKEILRSFQLSAKSIEKIRNNIERLQKQEVLNHDDINTMMASLKEVIKFATDIPKQISSLKDSLEDARREEKDTKFARGNVAITKSMMPEQ